MASILAARNLTLVPVMQNCNLNLKPLQCFLCVAQYFPISVICSFKMLIRTKHWVCFEIYLRGKAGCYRIFKVIFSFINILKSLILQCFSEPPSGVSTVTLTNHIPFHPLYYQLSRSVTRYFLLGYNHALVRGDPTIRMEPLLMTVSIPWHESILSYIAAVFIRIPSCRESQVSKIMEMSRFGNIL